MVFPLRHCCGSEKSTWGRKVGRTSPPLHPPLGKWTLRAASVAYKWDREPTPACNAAPGAAVSPAGAVSNGTETGSTVRDYRARRPACTGRQVHMQVTISSVNNTTHTIQNSFCSNIILVCSCDQAKSVMTEHIAYFA